MSEPDARTWYWEKTWTDFRSGTTRVRLVYEGGAATATLYDQGAPRTVAAVVAHLPFEIPVVHVAWSGDMVMSTRAYTFDARQMENAVHLPRPGDLGWDPKFGELTVTYGTGRMGGLIEDEIPPGSFSRPYGHFSAYAAIDEVEVVAVANRGAERLERFVKRFGVTNTYLDYRTMIEREKPDIVSVTTPSFARAEPIVFAAEHGVRGIYAEKGLCASLAEADRIRSMPCRPTASPSTGGPCAAITTASSASARRSSRD